MMSLENGEIQVKKCLLKEKVIQINPSSHPIHSASKNWNC